MNIDKLIKDATDEKEGLRIDIDALGVQIGKLKQQRAALLFENELQGGSPELQKVNEKLHNARRILNAWNRRRENLAFLLDYITGNEQEGGGVNE